MHSLKISHGDIKLENIIFDENTNEITLIDFGFSNYYPESISNNY